MLGGMKTKPTAAPVPKISKAWLRHEMREFYGFFKLTAFPEPLRDGTRGTAYTYPESFVMLLAVLAVKLKLKNYLEIHRFVVTYWETLKPAPDLPPISEPQMRMRLKKIRHTPGAPADFVFQLFPELEREYFS